MMEVGAKLIGMVKTNTKVLCKEIIVGLTKDWPGGSCLVFSSKPMLPGYRTPIAVGYKNNARKVLYFIVTDNAGSKNTGIPYLYKYPDQFTNVAILPVDRPLFMSKTLLLMILTPTTIQYSLVCHWRSGGLLSMVGCGYVQHLIWE